MNGRFASLAGRLTHRLRMDPDLRRDVAEELQSHLEASAAEHVEAGEPPERADELASRALGDERSLAEQLWRANRGRIRLRFWLRWTARVTLVPAAVFAVLLVPVSHWWQSSQSRSLQDLMHWQVLHLQVEAEPTRPAAPQPGELEAHPLLRGLDDAERRLLFGDPYAASAAESARAMVQAHPDDPAVYAHYALTTLRSLPGNWDTDPSPADALLPLVERGREIDPGNGLYDLIAARLPVHRGAQLDFRDASDPELLVRDHHEMEQAARLFAQAGEKRITTRTAQLVRRQLALLPPARSPEEYLLRQSAFAASAGTSLMPHLAHTRSTARHLAAYAMLLHEQGESERALQLLDTVERVGVRLGRDAEMRTTMLVAVAIQLQAMRHQVEILEAIGQGEQAAQRQAMHDELGARMQRFREDQPGISPSLMSLALTYQPALQEAHLIERVELAWMHRISLVAGLVMLGGLTLVAAVVGWVDLLRHREGSARPRLIWPRLRHVVPAAAAVVALLAGVYVVNLFGHGTNAAAALALVVAGLVVGLWPVFIATSLRRTMVDQGLPVAPGSPFWIGLVIAGATVLVLTLGLLMLAASSTEALAGLGVAALVLLALAGAGVARMWVMNRHWPAYRRNMVRSALPLLAGSLVVAGVLGGAASLYQERQAVSMVDRRAAVGFLHEMAHPAASEIRAWFGQQGP